MLARRLKACCFLALHTTTAVGFSRAPFLWQYRVAFPRSKNSAALNSVEARSFHRFSTAFAAHSRCQRKISTVEKVRSVVSDSSSSYQSKLKLFYNDIYEVPLPVGHRFPMGKYRMVREVLQNDHGIAHLLDLTPSPIICAGDLRTTHDSEYIKRFLCNQLTEKENRNIGFPWSRYSVKRSLSSVGGTVAAMHAVCRDGYTFAGHLAGGTHHAFYDRGEGFCVFSDIAVAVNVALRDYGEWLSRVLIVDLDVHQGNGNAVLFQQEDRVTTFSMHCEGNIFSKREQSDYDVDVPIGCEDEAYLAMLADWLPRLFDTVRPQVTVFQAGVDPLGGDRLGRLRLTRAGLRRRNAAVYAAALAHGSRLVVTMGGGYPADLDPASGPYREVVQAHADVYRHAALALSSAAAAAAAAA